MQESETHFNNMTMPMFRIPIMFKSVGRCNEMHYTMGHKEFTPIISIKCFNGGGEIIFNQLLEGNKG